MQRNYYRKPVTKSLDKDLRQLEITLWLTGRLLTFLQKLDMKSSIQYSSVDFATHIRHLHGRASRHILPDID